MNDSLKDTNIVLAGGGGINEKNVKLLGNHHVLAKEF